MSSRRPAVVAVLPAVLVLLGLGPARAQAGGLAPDTVAWWQVGALALVTGAGLEEGQLLVDGVGPDEASRQAVAGLSFPLAGGARPVSLSVPVASSVLPGTTVSLCPATARFDAVSGGAAEDVPAHDCSRAVVGEVGEDDILVADVGGLGAGTHLRVLLVPRQAGRIVLDGAAATLATAAGSEDLAPLPTPESTGSGGVPSSPTATSPPLPGPLEEAPAAEPGAPPAPAGDTPPPSSSSPDPGGSVLGPRAAGTVPYTAPGRQSAARLLTALAVAAALGAFTVLNRGGTARLRPAAVPWHRPEA